MKGKTWQGIRKYPPNIINKLKSVITYMFQLSVCRKLIDFIHSKKSKIKDSRNLVRNLIQIIKKMCQSVYMA